MTEIHGARLMLIEENNAFRVVWTEDSRHGWTDAERSRLCAIGARAAAGTDLETYLGLCAAMDERLAGERRRLAEVARDARFPLRSESFALAYYGFGDQIGFTHLACAGHPGMETHRGGQGREFSLKEMSSGQLHFFLENRRAFFGHDDDVHIAEELICLLRDRFRWEPYHVQLVILHAAGFVRSVPAETVERLVGGDQRARSESRKLGHQFEHHRCVEVPGSAGRR